MIKYAVYYKYLHAGPSDRSIIAQVRFGNWEVHKPLFLGAITRRNMTVLSPKWNDHRLKTGRENFGTLETYMYYLAIWLVT